MYYCTLCWAILKLELSLVGHLTYRYIDGTYTDILICIDIILNFSKDFYRPSLSFYATFKHLKVLLRSTTSLR